MKESVAPMIIIPPWHRSFTNSGPLSKNVQYEIYLDARKKLVALAKRQLLSFERIQENLGEIESFAFDWSLDTEAMKKRHPDLFFPWESIFDNLSNPDKADPF